jgi:hypothetical protein
MFFKLRLLLLDDRAWHQPERAERRLISLILAGRNRIIMILRELHLTVYRESG